MTLKRIYKILLQTYGPQGWWPVASRAGSRGFDDRGYHQTDYLTPRSFAEKFEIITGAILTQNTAWKNVELALENLRQQNFLSPRSILACPEPGLAALIKPSGYYNQKARKLKAMARFLIEHKLAAGRGIPTREALLAVWGVGPETADSILLYSYRVPVFVIDAYTKRIFSRLGLMAAESGYSAFQAWFHGNLPEDYVLFNEYHALLVAHAKEHCRVKPLCDRCPLLKPGCLQVKV